MPAEFDLQKTLERMESKIDTYALATATNSADISWLKKIVSFVGALAASAFAGFVSFIFGKT